MPKVRLRSVKKSGVDLVEEKKPEIVVGMVGKFEYEFEDGEKGGESNRILLACRAAVAQFLANTPPGAHPSHIGLGSGSIAQYARSNQNIEVSLKSTGADQKLAQEFVPTISTSVQRVLLHMTRVGSSTGELVLEIQGNTGGLPNGTVLGTSTPFSFNALPLSMDWAVFDFPTHVPVVSGTVYHLVLSGSGYTYALGTEEAHWCADNSAPTYASGDGETYNGSAWSALSPATDFIFRVVAEYSVSRTTLLDELDRNAISSGTNPSPAQARLVAVFTGTEADDRVAEVGLFDAPSGGNMLCSASVDMNKGARQVTAYWIIEVVEVLP